MMRWLNNNRDRPDDAVGCSAGESSRTSSSQSSCSENANHEKELIEFPQSPHSDRHQGKRRFSLFRRRRSDMHVGDGENELCELLSSESDRDGPYAETSVASVEGTTSLLDCSNEDINNTLDEGSRDYDQWTDTKEDYSSKFNWFGLLLKNNQTSSREENERDCESSVDHQRSADGDELSNRVDGDTTHDDKADSGGLHCGISDSTKEVRTDSTKSRFGWFGLLQPSHSASSCMENDLNVIQQEEDEQRLVNKDEGEDTEEAGVEDEIVCSYDRCESSAEVSSDDSMDTDDIVIFRKVTTTVTSPPPRKSKKSWLDDLIGEPFPSEIRRNYARSDSYSRLEISDDERLQAQFDKCPTQDQQEEQQHPICGDNSQCDVSIHVMEKDNAESEFFVKKDAPLSDEILALWQRRQRLKRKLQFDGPSPIHETSVPTSMKMLGTSQIEVGGGRNEENLRSLELEAHLIDKNSNRKMTKMETMTAEEKVREDLLYDMFLQDCLLMAGEEPQDGYDNLGWYSTLTQREDGEADLEYMKTSDMHVGTEDDATVKSNRWLDGIGNAALFIFAPDLYFIQQMSYPSLEPQYHPTSNKEDGEHDAGKKEGWFRRMFSNEGG